MLKRLNQLNPKVKLLLGSVIIIALLVIGYRFGGAGISGQANGSTISTSDAEVCLRAGGTIYFNVTYGTETYLEKVGLWEQAEPKLRFSQPFVFNASTHVGTIQDLDLTVKVFMQYDDGLYPTIGQPIASTTHHDTWLIFLPKFDMGGEPIFDTQTGFFEILVEGVDIPEHRVFTFNFPLPVATMQLSPTRIMMIIGAAMAAMLLTCTPCLVGSLTVGSLAMGSAWGTDETMTALEIRKNLIKQTVYYLIALVVAYAAVAIAATSFNFTMDDIRPFEVMGGVLLMIVGLEFLRQWKPVILLENAIVKTTVKLIPAFAQYVTSDDAEPGLGSSSSTAMGASLAMVCSVAGAPTLTTAIILPVVIFAGLNDIYWSLLILLIYLIVTALPFFLISVGLGEFLLSLSFTIRKK
ncbi:MAG: hypothetical protein N2D54_01575, partial [Chloroflexota bacterium]